LKLALGKKNFRKLLRSLWAIKSFSHTRNFAAGGGARPVRETLFERWREGKTAAFAPQQVRPSSRNAWPASPLAVARDSEGSMQAWQVLARAGLGDGDAAAPQAAAPRPRGNAADVAAARGCPPFSPRQSPAQPPAEPIWGTLRVCATPGPHGGPWPVLETEGHFVTRLANTVCAVWTWVCANNLYQEVIGKWSFCQVGKTNHHANENGSTQTLSPTDLLPKIVTDTVTYGKYA